MYFRYKVENVVVVEVHFAETESGALWLARWQAARFAAARGILGAYQVYDLAVSPPALLRVVAWEPPPWSFRPAWPYGWTYSER